MKTRNDDFNFECLEKRNVKTKSFDTSLYIKRYILKIYRNVFQTNKAPHASRELQI